MTHSSFLISYQKQFYPVSHVLQQTFISPHRLSWKVCLSRVTAVHCMRDNPQRFVGYTSQDRLKWQYDSQRFANGMISLLKQTLYFSLRHTTRHCACWTEQIGEQLANRIVREWKEPTHPILPTHPQISVLAEVANKISPFLWRPPSSQFKIFTGWQ